MNLHNLFCSTRPTAFVGYESIRVLLRGPLVFAVTAITFVLSGSESSAQTRKPEKPSWVELITEDFDAWRGKPKANWLVGGDAKLDSKNPRKLVSIEGKGVIVNGKSGRLRDLLSRQNFGDVELHLEFLVSRGSNSGIKFHGHYEIQIKDSHGRQNVTAKDCGGIYPRAEFRPRYRHIDKGIPPKCNAAKPAGQWQTLDVTFLAPRFDKDGKKIANAKLVKVLLNDKMIHENLELKTPTGHFWRRKEMAEGPIRLQADHGPVAFRSCRVRPLSK